MNHFGVPKRSNSSTGWKPAAAIQLLTCSLLKSISGLFRCGVLGSSRFISISAMRPVGLMYEPSRSETGGGHPAFDLLLAQEHFGIVPVRRLGVVAVHLDQRDAAGGLDVRAEQIGNRRRPSSF